MFTSNKRQHGAATLVGVLIAMVVAGIGLYALMQAQGEMTSGISNSKARTQAKELAQLKIQELHGYIEKNQFTADLPLTPLAKLEWDITQPDFTHANLTVNVDKIYEEWLIRRAGCDKSSTDAWCTDLSVNNPNGTYLEVMVRESWVDEEGNTQSVYLNNFINFVSPTLMTSIKQEAEGRPSRGVLARRGRWGDERAEEGTEGDERKGESPDIPIGTNIYKGVNSKGNWEIYTGTGTAKVVLTAKGGIIHEIKGRVFFEGSGIAVEDLAVLATSPAYCVFPLNINVAEGYADYACYVPGDCSNEVDDYANINEACKGGVANQTELTVHLAKIKSLKLDGGWYGKVGLLLTSSKNVPEGKIPKACLKDLILNDPDDPSHSNYKTIADLGIVPPDPPVFTFESPARYFASRRIINDPNDNPDVGVFVQQFEGINQPLACQDMLFTTLAGNETCQDAAVDAVGIPSPQFATGDPSSPYFEFDNKLRDLLKLDSDGNLIVPYVPIPNTIEEPEIYGMPPVPDDGSPYQEVCHDGSTRYP